jgi:hypothetical protein
MAGVPLLYIAFNAINLEPPSDASRTKAEAKIHDMLTPSAHERVALSEMKKSSDLRPEEAVASQISWGPFDRIGPGGPTHDERPFFGLTLIKV